VFEIVLIFEDNYDSTFLSNNASLGEHKRLLSETLKKNSLEFGIIMFF